MARTNSGAWSACIISYIEDGATYPSWPCRSNRSGIVDFGASEPDPISDRPDEREDDFDRRRREAGGYPVVARERTGDRDGAARRRRCDVSRHTRPPQSVRPRVEDALVIGGFTLEMVEHGGFEQACESCMYYQVHRRWCELPELDLPVEPEWSCRLWRI